ncbi:MAG: DUF4262 domain-containing protein [Mycobacteriaceae bacterium]|nr:DUF4262 domain-containing protein [Mycobacteriaceae bacterium]
MQDSHSPEPHCSGPSCNGVPDTPATPTAWRDQVATATRERIRTFGWSINYILGDADEPPFAYTVGLTAFGHPELIVFATSSGAARALLNALGNRVRRGETLAADRPLTVEPLEPHRLRLVPVPPAHSELYLVEANSFYRSTHRDPVPAVQVVIDDADGRFPWDPDFRRCAHTRHAQPVLGAPPTPPTAP